MKITIAQLNPRVGDIDGNLAKILEVLEKCGETSDLVVFPELFLVGYPPRDLLGKNWFIKKVQEAVKKLSRISGSFPNTGLLVGAPLPNPKASGKALYNAALLIHKGRVRAIQHKSFLPGYDFFDEQRYFESSSIMEAIPFKGEKLGVTICEDAWDARQTQSKRKIYAGDPIKELVKKGATVMVNITASPFYMGKEEIRYRLIRANTIKCKVPCLYVNQVGGNDELIFDGRSMCFDGRGNLVAVFPAFEEHIETIDINSAKPVGAYLPMERIASVHDALVLGIRDYLRKTGFSKALIGLSGGIDSALTCCLAVEALGAKNVLGISMPSLYSSRGSVEDSRILAANLGVEFKVIPINTIFNSYLEVLKEHFDGMPEDLTEENIQARIRANLLMAFSNKFGYLLLSTGNKSESAVGYCTLYGDTCGGLSVISDVPKTMVYELARYINNKNKSEIIPSAIMDKPPSAELKPGQLDQDTLPPYPILDQILDLYLEKGFGPAEIIAGNFDPEVVNWVIETVNRNEYKRKQSAVGLVVTSKVFGTGRRMPIAAKY